jgi:hypothetical protein
MQLPESHDHVLPVFLGQDLDRVRVRVRVKG